MADAITGLGMTEEEAQSSGNLYNLATLHDMLKEQESRKQSFTTALDSIRAEDGYVIYTDPEGEDVHRFPLMDAATKRSLGGFLDIPVPYLERIGSELAATNIEWHLRQNATKEAEFMSVDGVLVDIADPSRPTPVSVLEAVQSMYNAVGGNATVRRYNVGLHTTTIDVSHPEVTVAPEREVGDITEGGVRIVVSHNNLAPVVGTYFHRLVCSNGMVAVMTDDKISVKGSTKEEVLGSMDDRLGVVWDRIPSLLHAYADLATQRVMNPRRMIELYANEHNIPERVKLYALAAYSKFAEDSPNHEFTQYDVIQLFTSLAHHPNVKTNAAEKLMALAGHVIVANSSEHRCDQCHAIID